MEAVFKEVKKDDRDLSINGQAGSARGLARWGIALHMRMWLKHEWLREDCIGRSPNMTMRQTATTGVRPEKKEVIGMPGAYASPKTSRER